MKTEPKSSVTTSSKTPTTSTTNGTSATKPAPRNVFKIDEPEIQVDEIMDEPCANDDFHQIDHFGDDDDIDFSTLETDKIKLEENIKTKVPEPVSAKPTISPDVKPKTDIFANIKPNWDNAFGMEDEDDADLLNAVADESMFADEKQSDMKFWYWDAWEDPNIPGQIFLFGKIAADSKAGRSVEFKSICVKVENVEHCVYVLPREFVCL